MAYLNYNLTTMTINLHNRYTNLTATFRATIAALAIILASGITTKCLAQLNPFQTVFFQNKYQIDPAMAGLDAGLNLNLNYKQQWSTFPGSPKTESITAEYHAGDKVGLGLNINNDQAGLIRQTRAMATYAYHLPLSDQNQKLNFGLSLGINDPFIDYSKVVGDQTDVQIANYNQSPYVDGDLGIAYTSNNLSVEGVIPNLKAVFFKSNDDRIDVDRTVFFTAASYKIPLQQQNNGMILEPKLAFRGVKGYDDIVDAGFNFMMNNFSNKSLSLNFQGLYHSNKSIGLGLGMEQRDFALNFAYNVETGSISNYSSGTFELGLKLKLLGKL